jgi:gas vesicle protein
MKAFLFGLGQGIGLGVLFAPMSGEETRTNLSDRANDLANTARETFEQGRDKVQRGISQVRNMAGNVAGGENRPTGTESNI